MKTKSKHNQYPHFVPGLAYYLDRCGNEARVTATFASRGYFPQVLRALRVQPSEIDDSGGYYLVRCTYPSHASAKQAMRRLRAAFKRLAKKGGSS